MTTLHTGCGREVHHGGCTCREDAEIAALKAEVERAKVQPLPSNPDGYLAFRDMVCAALDIEPWSSRRPVEEIKRLKAEMERLREYERIHGARSNEIARLKAEVERLRDGFDVQVEAITRRDRALAAGPAALRKHSLVGQKLHRIVERAQEAAMKEGT